MSQPNPQRDYLRIGTNLFGRPKLAVPAHEQTKSELEEFAVDQPGHQISVKKILAPTDFSPMSMRIIQSAVDFAARYSATLTILHVIDVLQGCRTGSARNMMQNLWIEASEKISQLSRCFRGTAELRFVLKEGLPWEEIVLQSRNYDLLIIPQGRRCRRWKNFFSKNTLTRVEKEAECPIMTLQEQGAPTLEFHTCAILIHF